MQQTKPNTNTNINSNTKPKTNSEKKNKIFLQAIDQNYENNKTNLHEIPEDNFNDSKNGDLKINFDFINFNEENPEAQIQKSLHKLSEEILSNSCNSSFSTEIENPGNLKKPINKFLTENKNMKIGNFLNEKYQEKEEESLDINSLNAEIFKIKKNLRQIITDKIKNKNPNVIINANYLVNTGTGFNFYGNFLPQKFTFNENMNLSYNSNFNMNPTSVTSASNGTSNINNSKKNEFISNVTNCFFQQNFHQVNMGGAFYNNIIESKIFLKNFNKFSGV